MSTPSTLSPRDIAPGEATHPVAMRAVAWALTIWGAIGALASALLMYEKVMVLLDPSHKPVCSINPVLSCGSVLMTPQASIFGELPNPVIGLLAFPVVITTGVALLAGARLPRWWWWALLGGTLLGVVMIHWLAWQSFMVIGALCPYCMVVWLATMCVLAAVVRQMGRSGMVSPHVGAWAWPGVLIWVTLVVAAAVMRFWDYWSTLL